MQQAPNPAAPRVAYVGSRTSVARDGLGRGIEVFAVPADPTKPWRHRQQVLCDNPTYLIFGPDRSTVYCAHGDTPNISAYEVDPDTGTLSLINRIDGGGTNPVHLAVSPDQRYLLVANHNTGTLSSLIIKKDGSIGDLMHVLAMPGTPGPHRVAQDSSKPHQIVFDPAGRFAVVPDKGLDRLFVITIDEHGALQLHPDRTVAAREMSGPRHAVFHPTLPYLYTVEEFRSTVTTYRYDPDTFTVAPLQILSSVPDTVTGDSRGGEIAIHPSGEVLYVSNRGGAGDHTPGGDQPDTIGAFRIDPDSGRLTDPTWTETEGIRPRFFCLLDGDRVIVSHERGHTVAQHPLNPNGTLGPPRRLAETPSAVVVLI